MPRRTRQRSRKLLPNACVSRSVFESPMQFGPNLLESSQAKIRFVFCGGRLILSKLTGGTTCALSGILRLLERYCQSAGRFEISNSTDSSPQPHHFMDFS